MKRQKGRVIPSDSEILKRLDKIEKGLDLTFTYSILLTLAIFAISVSASLFVMYSGLILLFLKLSRTKGLT